MGKDREQCLDDFYIGLLKIIADDLGLDENLQKSSVQLVRNIRGAIAALQGRDASTIKELR